MKDTRKYERVIGEKGALSQFRGRPVYLGYLLLEQATLIEPKQSAVVAVDRCLSIIVPHRKNVTTDLALLNRNTRSLC